MEIVFDVEYRVRPCVKLDGAVLQNLMRDYFRDRVLHFFFPFSFFLMSEMMMQLSPLHDGNLQLRQASMISGGSGVVKPS